MKWKVAALFVSMAAADLVGCGGSLSKPDAGGGSGGSSAGGDGGAIPTELRAQLDMAIAAWAAAKNGCRTYSYDRTWSSVFGSFASTEVEIQGDVATRRRYSTGDHRDGGASTVAWDETGSAVGQHGSRPFSPFPASTMEQLLAECAETLAHDPTAYMLRLDVEPTYGVPRTCTNFPAGCFDDCESGIRIASFSCAPLEE